MNRQTDSPAASGRELQIALGPITEDRANITLIGRLDMVEAIAVRERVASEELVDVRHLTFDLRAVSFIDSAGLAVLARSRRDLMLVGGSVTLVRPHAEDAMRVFHLTQFDEIFTMTDSLESDAD
jgi:anti-sigma B factor antagonist